jgi:hypothetical protein
MFVWDRRKEANAGLVKQPFSYHGFHKLVVRPDNLEDFPPRSDPPVEFV